MTEIRTRNYECERPECIRAQRDELAARMAAETSNARGDAEYEYEVWQGDALQAGGSTTDYASAQSEAGHYAMMYASGGPVEVRIYEKRLLNAAPQPTAARGDVRYDRELIAQMLDAAESPAFTMEEMGTQARLLREAAQAKPEARGVVDEGSRIVTSQLLHWGGIPVRVTGTVTTSPGNWPLIDAALTEARDDR